MDKKTYDFLTRVTQISELEEKCPCKKLFQLAIDYRMTLEELRDEIRLLISMPDDEVKTYEVKFE